MSLLAREARSREARGMMGRRKEESLPLLPSHRPLRARYRNSPRRPFRDLLQDCVRVSGRVTRIVSHGRGLF